VLDERYSIRIRNSYSGDFVLSQEFKHQCVPRSAANQRATEHLARVECNSAQVAAALGRNIPSFQPGVLRNEDFGKGPKTNEAAFRGSGRSVGVEREPGRKVSTGRERRSHQP
jgi:hypothetical protein